MLTKIKCALFILTGLIWCCSAFSQSDTTCLNLSQINSSSDEYLPFLIDSSLLFTSNIKNTLEGQTLEFTEKVYLSHKKVGKWSVARKVGYKWNSDNNTALVGVGPKSYFFYRSYWKNNGEIFMSSRKEDTLKSMKAHHLKKMNAICSDSDENSITTLIEDTFYFVTNRSGNYDIYMQAGKNKPVPVEILNSPFDEQDVFLCNKGKSIFYSSDRPGGKGGYDIYRSDKMNNHWSAPILIQSKFINTESDDRDFRLYNDSTMFLSSNRSGGLGGFDIYEIIVKKIPQPIPLKVEDTVKLVKTDVIEQIKKIDLNPFRCELQLGAYRYIKSIAAFKETFKCLANEDLRIDTQNVDGAIIYKYLINKVYTDVMEALTKQMQIINLSCLPNKDFQDMPFVAILDQDGNRYSIFWKKDEFENKSTFNIFSNGKPVWKGRRF